MHNPFRLIPLLIVLAMLPVPVAQAESKTPKRCQPIGRVASPQGKVVCDGDQLPLIRLIQRNLQFACFSTAELIPIVGGQLAKKCPASRELKQTCSRVSLSGCTKRGDESTALLLDKPNGSVLLQTPDQLSWTPIPEAVEYRVSVIPADAKPLWFRQVKGNEMAYPTDAEPLKAGSVYSVVVQALDASGNSIAQNSTTLIVLHDSEQQKIARIKAVIDAAGLSDDDRALETEVLYRDRRLQEASISLLETRVTAGSQNPNIYKVLGDLYRQEGLIDLAGDRYTTAADIAAKQNDEELLSEVQKELLELESRAESIDSKTTK